MQQSRSITRKSASNLALAFFLLPKPRRDAMCALYAFCRQVDDVADEDSRPVEERRKLLREWRADIRTAFTSETPRMELNRELQPVIKQYRLRQDHFEEILDGVEMDLDTRRYANYTELDIYCYRVASAVGLLSIEIFGYRSPSCREYAVHLGRALQLTNILRDVKTDAARGRIYLPKTEMDRFQVSEEDILQSRYTERYKALAQSVAGRANHHYQLASQYLSPVDRPAMVAAELMAAVYRALLAKLTDNSFDVFAVKPVRLSRFEKLILMVKAWWNMQRGSNADPAVSTP